MVYRIIEEGDDPNKGRHEGCCNTRGCMQPHSERTPIHYYNFGTGSYYCYRCAVNLNRANSNMKENMKYMGVHPMVQILNPDDVVLSVNPHSQSVTDLQCLEK